MFLSALGMAHLACASRENNGLGTAIVEDRSELKAVRDTLVSAPDTSADFQLTKRPPLVGASGTLTIGERTDLNYLARAVVRFDSTAFPDSGVVIDSASVALKFLGGATMPPSFSLSVHRVLAAWTETGVDTTEFPLFEASALDTASFDGPEAGDTLHIRVSSLVQDWVEEDSTNFGLALVALPGTEAILEFASSEVAEPNVAPTLTIWWQGGGSDTSSTLTPTQDTFVLETTQGFTPLAGEPRRLTIGRGIPTRSLLRFEFPDLGARATLNRAELTFHLDPLLSELTSFGIAVRRVNGEWMADSTEVALTVATGTVAAEDDSVTIVVTELVEEMIRQGNDGFLMRARDERPDADYFRFHAQDSEDPSLTPKLRLWFTPGGGP